MLQSADSPACCTDAVLCLLMAEMTRRQPLPLSTREQRSSAGDKGGVGGGGRGKGRGGEERGRDGMRRGKGDNGIHIGQCK